MWFLFPCRATWGMSFDQPVREDMCNARLEGRAVSEVIWAPGYTTIFNLCE